MATIAISNIARIGSVLSSTITNTTPQLLGACLIGPLTGFGVIHSMQVAQQVDRERILGTKDVDGVCPCAIKIITL